MHRITYCETSILVPSCTLWFDKEIGVNHYYPPSVAPCVVNVTGQITNAAWLLQVSKEMTHATVMLWLISPFAFCLQIQCCLQGVFRGNNIYLRGTTHHYYTYLLSTLFALCHLSKLPPQFKTGFIWRPSQSLTVGCLQHYPAVILLSAHVKADIAQEPHPTHWPVTHIMLSICQDYEGPQWPRNIMCLLLFPLWTNADLQRLTVCQCLL